jgi:plastocyanin
VALANKQAKNTGTPNTNSPAANQSEETPGEGTTTEVKDAFREEVPTDIKVPEVGEKLTEAEAKITAVPTVVTPAAPGVSAQFRSFDIKAENNQYVPLKVIGRVGDTIHVNFTAVDKDYDIVFPSYNMKQTAKKGETKILEFQAVQEGSFTYYCEMCGGADGPTKGNIIIAK